MPGTYTAFWLYKADSDWRRLENTSRGEALAQFQSTIQNHAGSTDFRGAYSTVGFRHDVDMILWCSSSDPAALQSLAVDINKTELGKYLDTRYTYLGVVSASKYEKNHGPAFVKGLAPKRYLSVYPFTKTPDWYLLSFEERKDMMRVHGQLGQEYPSILTNTVSSFGINDQEFIVALEDDDPSILVDMVQRLRLAEVRKYTQIDTPIFLGLLKPLNEVLEDLG